MQSTAKSLIIIIHPERCDGAILTAGQPSLRSPLSTGPRQMTWHWKIAWNRDGRRTDGRIRVDRRVFRGKRSTLARRTAPSRYRSVHVRGTADEWSRSPRYGPVTRDVIYNPHRGGVEGLYVITSGTFPLSFLFFFSLLCYSFSCKRPPLRSRLRAINLSEFMSDTRRDAYRIVFTASMITRD
jgi:hypothetical protein